MMAHKENADSADLGELKDGVFSDGRTDGFDSSCKLLIREEKTTSADPLDKQGYKVVRELKRKAEMGGDLNHRERRKLDAIVSSLLEARRG